MKYTAFERYTCQVTEIKECASNTFYAYINTLKVLKTNRDSVLMG